VSCRGDIETRAERFLIVCTVPGEEGAVLPMDRIDHGRVSSSIAHGQHSIGDRQRSCDCDMCTRKSDANLTAGWRRSRPVQARARRVVADGRGADDTLPRSAGHNTESRLVQCRFEARHHGEVRLGGLLGDGGPPRGTRRVGGRGGMQCGVCCPGGRGRQPALGELAGRRGGGGGEEDGKTDGIDQISG